MRDLLGSGTVLGYCTNVHAGATLAEALANLGRYAPNIKARVSASEPMGVGLWFSASAAHQLTTQNGVASLRDWMGQHALMAYTLNGFPFGDFHGPVVKHSVYEPNWSDPRRLNYTKDLARILAGLLPDGAEGSISTMPVARRAPGVATSGISAAAAAQLTDLVHFLARLELDTGHLIHVDLEPEPGCLLERSADVAGFFQDYLLGGSDDVSVLSYLRICHDICHCAVMFEEQSEALARYRAAGIKVGKVQISSGIRIAFDAMSSTERQTAFAQLKGFSEPRYLHQTMIRGGSASPAFFDDLPDAVASVTEGGPPTGEWRVHFHVPVFMNRIGLLEGTQGQIAQCLRAITPADEVHHFEIETYAWDVLPGPAQAPDLAAGIAQELEWVKQTQSSREAPHAR